MYLWYSIWLRITRFLYWLAGCRVRGVGQQNVPREGPLLVAPNHLSNLDPFAVACGTSRHLRFMAKEELFRPWFSGGLIRSLGAFPVKRGEADTEAIRNAIDLVKGGEGVLIFPEGTRGDGKVLQPLNRGMAMIAKRTGAKVLPVGIVGSQIAWPRGQRMIKRHPIIIAYGEPFTYEEVATGQSERENRELFAAELQRRIAKLCEENGLKLEIQAGA